MLWKLLILWIKVLQPCLGIRALSPAAQMIYTALQRPPGISANISIRKVEALQTSKLCTSPVHYLCKYIRMWNRELIRGIETIYRVTFRVHVSWTMRFMELVLFCRVWLDNAQVNIVSTKCHPFPTLIHMCVCPLRFFKQISSIPPLAWPFTIRVHSTLCLGQSASWHSLEQYWTTLQRAHAGSSVRFFVPRTSYRCPFLLLLTQPIDFAQACAWRVDSFWKNRPTQHHDLPADPGTFSEK